MSRPIPIEPTIALDGGYGSYGYGKFHGWAGGTWENLGLLVEGVHLESSGFKELDGGGNTGFDRNEVTIKGEAGFELGADLFLMNSIKVGYSDEGSNETYLGISDADFAENPYRRYAASRLARMEWHRQQYQFSQVLSWEDRLDLRLTGYRHDFKRKWRKLSRVTHLGFEAERDAFVRKERERAVLAGLAEGIEEEGDASMYMTFNLKTRAALRLHPLVTAALDEWWAVAERSLEASGHTFVGSDAEITKAEYVQLSRCLFKALVRALARMFP